MQTFTNKNTESTLTDWYANIITTRKDQLKQISNIIVADAWFSKRKFTDEIILAEMNLISRFRDDADLLYLFHGQHSGGKGRPKKYDGKIIHKRLL